MALPKVVTVAVTILSRGTRLIAGEVGLRLAVQLHGLQASVPPEVVQVGCVWVGACVRACVHAGRLM